MQSGRPFTVALLPGDRQQQHGPRRLGFGANDRPNSVGDPDASRSRPPERWFNTAAFAFPPFGTFGNAGRNMLEGPGYQNVNLGVLKRVPLGAARALQLRLEAFNLLNRDELRSARQFPRLADVRADSVGGRPRRIQIGAKLIF